MFARDLFGEFCDYHYIVEIGCREQPLCGAPWVAGLVRHFVQTWTHIATVLTQCSS